MMMQMLAAGGLPLLTDGVRPPDCDNPRGYFEFEPVKRTREDPSWVPTAVGKAVKMVTMLLRDLPGEFDYRVILMYRDPEEVLASQKAMLGRSGRKAAATPPSKYGSEKSIRCAAVRRVDHSGDEQIHPA